MSYVKKFSMAMRTIEPSTKVPDGRGSVGNGFEFFLLLGTSEEASLGRDRLETWGLGGAAFPLRKRKEKKTAMFVSTNDNSNIYFALKEV